MSDTTPAAIVALLDGVTPGPWRVGPVDDCRVEDADGNEVAQIDGDYNQPETWPLMEANARFIAAARDLVPALAAERDRMAAENERLRAALNGAEAHIENLLSVMQSPDKQMCCDGRMCGCMGATVYQEADYYAREQLRTIRAALKGETP